MWAEVITGGTVVSLIGLMYRIQQKKIDSKVGKTTCDVHLNTFNDLLVKGDKKFEKITDKLTEIGETVARIDERTRKNNGRGMK